MASREKPSKDYLSMLNGISFADADSDHPKKVIKYGSRKVCRKARRKTGKKWNDKCLVVVPVFARDRLWYIFFDEFSRNQHRLFFAIFWFRGCHTTMFLLWIGRICSWEVYRKAISTVRVFKFQTSGFLPTCRGELKQLKRVLIFLKG